MSDAGLLRRFSTDETGSVLIEFAVVLCIFFLLVFGIIDFARLGFSNVMAEKAMETAVRMATVRPVACEDVPTVNQRGLLGTLSVDLPNGTACTARAGLCVEAETVSCTGASGNATSSTIWAQIAPLLPVNAVPDNLQFSYSFDPELNRVGAPYAPIVTVTIVDLQFDFISPLGALAALAGANDTNELGASFVFPSLSASLPSEDLK